MEQSDALSTNYSLYIVVCACVCRGRRVQALSWTTEGFSAAKLKKAEIEWSSRDTLDVAKKVCMMYIRSWDDFRVCERMTHVLFLGPLTQRSQRGPPDLKKPLFQIIPDKFVLQPYQSQVITLQGCSPMYMKQSACSRQVYITLPPLSLPLPPVPRW